MTKQIRVATNAGTLMRRESFKSWVMDEEERIEQEKEAKRQQEENNAS